MPILCAFLLRFEATVNAIIYDAVKQLWVGRIRTKEYDYRYDYCAIWNLSNTMRSATCKASVFFYWNWNSYPFNLNTFTKQYAIEHPNNILVLLLHLLTCLARYLVTLIINLFVISKMGFVILVFKCLRPKYKKAHRLEHIARMSFEKESV